MTIKAILVIGPAGCGKTLHAKALAEYFGCVEVCDDWTPSKGLTPGVLHLTSMVPGGTPLPFQDDTLSACTFNDAMGNMTAFHAEILKQTDE